MAIQNGFIQIIQDEKRDYQYEEAMKTLRTNIQFSGNGLKVIMLTSAMPAFRGGSVSHEPAEPGYHFLRSDGTEPGRASERGCI